MDQAEARSILAFNLLRYRQRSFTELLRLIDEPEVLAVIGASGVQYQLEVQAVWDDRARTQLRIMASIDDGGSSAFRPLTDDFLIAPDGSPAGVPKH